MNREGRLSTLEAKIQAALEAFFGHPIPVIGLPQISEQDVKLVQTITNNASKIVWITNADLLSGARPNFAPVLSLSRALMLEQP